MSDQTTPIEPSSPYSHSCVSCGGATTFTPGADVLRCPYCGHEHRLDPPAGTVREHPYDAQRVPAEDIDPRRFACRNCGAHPQGDAVSQLCQFCTAPLVLDTAADHQITPEAVLPFTLDRAAARERLHEWMEASGLDSSRLRNVAEQEPLTSTYLPYWTFDTAATANYTGRRGTFYWTTETYLVTTNGTTQTHVREVRKIRWGHADGTVTRDFDDVLVTATRQVATTRLDKLNPWPLTEAVPFQPGHLAGHASLRYDIEPDEGLNQARYKMVQILTADCHQDIGGDDQRVESLDIAYSGTTYKLVLLPVWVGTFRYDGRPWQVLINGRTGQVQGDRSHGRASVTNPMFVAIALVAVAIIMGVLLTR